MTNNSAKDSDIYSRAAAWARLTGHRVLALEEVSSTNTLARNDDHLDTRPLLSPDPDRIAPPTLYLAKNQTSGRGRGANTWSTAEGALLSSWAFQLRRHPQPILAPLVGLALFESARQTWHTDQAFNLKAPNDLYIGKRKVAGLLLEISGSQNEMRLVVGLGLNVTTAPPSLETATCVADHCAEAAAEGRLEQFLESWRQSLADAVHSGLSSELSDTMRSRLRDALNLHPLLSERIIDVGVHGELLTPSRVIHWQDL